MPLTGVRGGLERLRQVGGDRSFDPELGHEVPGERRRHLQTEGVPRIRESEPDLKRRPAEQAGDPFFIEPPAGERFFELDLEGFIGGEQKFEQGIPFAG